MYDQNDRGSSIFMSALIGGLAGALVVFLSDEKRRKKIKEGLDDLMEEGMEKREEFQEKIDDTIDRGRKNLVKKLRETEKAIDKAGRK